MTRHLLKLIWNRRRTNLLVTIEILISFLVLFGVVSLAVFYLDNYRQPLGFDRENVLVVSVDRQASLDELPKDEQARVVREWKETWRQMLLALSGFAEVVAASGAENFPYSHSTWISSSGVNGREVSYEFTYALDGLDEVLRLRLVRGGWFDRSHDGAAWTPIVINSRLAREVFGDEDPIGRTWPQEKTRDGTPPPELRVVGEVDAYREHGELSSPVNYMWQRKRLMDEAKEPSTSTLPPRIILLRLQPGTAAAFEEKLVKRLQAIAKDWSFETRLLSEHREDVLREALVPLVAVAIVAVFLMLMVAMGLTGVLWQTVTQRTREVGLRRAKGATARRIHRQVLGELALMTTIALLAGVAIVVQFPLLDLIGWVSPGIFTASLALSVGAIYLLTMACGWYPSRMATRIQPAEALHYE